MARRKITDSSTITWDEETTGVLKAHASPASGQMFLQNNATETSLVQNTWTKVAGTTLENDIQQRFDKPVPGRLRYIGTQTAILQCAVSFAVIAADNNQTFEFAIFENGVIHEESVIGVALTGSGASDRVSVHLIVEFETNDYVELYMRNTTSSGNATIPSMQFTVH